MFNKLPNEILYKIAGYGKKRTAGNLFNAVNQVYKPSRSSFHGKQRMVHKLLKKPVSKSRWNNRNKNIYKASRNGAYQPFKASHIRGYNSKGRSMLRNVNAGRARHRGITKSWNWNSGRRQGGQMRR